MASIKELMAITGSAPEQTPEPKLKTLNPGSDTDKVIQNIMKGIREKPTNGNRNRFVHVVASDFNRFGINENDACHYLLQYQEKDFTASEIRATVRSAYQRRNEFATRNFNLNHLAKTSHVDTSTSFQENDRIELLLKCELDYDNPPLKPPTAIKIGSETVCTLGNFTIIIGKAKSRKTTFISSIISAALSHECLNVTSELPEGKKGVIYFDTEQSSYHVYKAFNRISRQAGNTKNLRVFKLREVKTASRSELIEQALETIEGTGLVIIDGIRDLITDINSQEQATEISDKLLLWTSKHQISIILVLHQNKADNNARGHVGSELVNKAETTISVEKDAKNKEISVVKAEYCRNMDFESFAFRINEDDLPEIVYDFQVKENPSPRKVIKASEIDNSTHRDFLKRIFSGNPKQQYNEFLENIIKTYGQNFGKNKAGEFIKYYETQGLIMKIGTPGTKQCYYSLNQN